MMPFGNLAVLTPVEPPLAPISDEQPWIDLINCIAQGDQEAMSTFYDATKTLVYGLALRILKSHESAEDITLEVYVQVWKQSNSYDSKRGRPSTWLCLLTRSRAIDALRASDRLNQNLEIFGRHPRSQTSEPLERSSEIDEQCRWIRTALATLPLPQRKVLELAYFSGLTHAEIASRLGVPTGTVKSRLRLGLLKLRQLCEPLMP